MDMIFLSIGKEIR
jgi:hypothetical protein